MSGHEPSSLVKTEMSSLIWSMLCVQMTFVNNKEKARRDKCTHSEHRTLAKGAVRRIIRDEEDIISSSL